MSYAYHAISSYFNRDNVALPGMVSFFRYNSEDEREHAQKLMNFQVGLLRMCYLLSVMGTAASCCPVAFGCDFECIACKCSAKLVACCGFTCCSKALAIQDMF